MSSAYRRGHRRINVGLDGQSTPATSEPLGSARCDPPELQRESPAMETTACSLCIGEDPSRQCSLLDRIVERVVRVRHARGKALRHRVRDLAPSIQP